MSKPSPEKIIVISPAKVLASALRLSLTSISDIPVEHCETEEDFHRIKYNLIEKNRIPVVLVLLGADELEYWLWSVLRAEEELLNPVIVLGTRPAQEVLARHPIFADAAGKYHHYLAPPWHLHSLMETLRTIKPLYDDNVRDHFFRKFGQPDFYGRITRVLHDFKGVDAEKDTLALQNAWHLASLLKDERLIALLDACLCELKANRQDQARLLKPKLLDLIHERNST